MAAGLDLLPLPPVERIPLKHPPLMLALCQVQFTPVLGVADANFVTPFHGAIRAQYPFPSQVATAGVQIQVGPGVFPNPQQVPTSYHWEFNDLVATWKVVLTPTSVSIETRNYSSFSEFLDRLEGVVDALIRYVQPPLGTRVGLRYINELRPRERNWASVISPEMLGPLAVPAFRSHVEQIAGLQQLVLRYPENQGITINHGLLPDGTTIRLRPGEEAPGGSFYLLDFDVYREFPMPDGLLINPVDVMNYVKHYHDIIYRAFRWSITEGYLRTLKGE